MESLVCIVLFLPLLGAILPVVFSQNITKRVGAYLAISMVCASFLVALILTLAFDVQAMGIAE